MSTPARRPLLRPLRAAVRICAVVFASAAGCGVEPAPHLDAFGRPPEAREGACHRASSGPPDGDCNGDFTVVLGEVQAARNAALGLGSVDECRAADADRNGEVSLGEAGRAFDNLLGCDEPTVELHIGSGQAVPGGAVTVTIEMRGSPAGATSAVGMDLLFDATDVRIPNPSPDCVLDPRLTEHQFGVRLFEQDRSPPGMGRLRLGILSRIDGTPIETFEDGPLVHCTFQISSHAAGGHYRLTAAYREVITAQAATLRSAVVEGSIEVAAGRRGICCESSCPPPQRCDLPLSEGMCLPPLDDGEPCTGDDHCLSGFCRAGRCSPPECDEGEACRRGLATSSDGSSISP